VVEHAGGIALRQDTWKFIPPGRTRDQLGPGVNVKIPEPGFLFDLANDPGETNNLALTRSEQLEELRSNLAKIRRGSITQ
jgi:arylsulfatase A